MQFPGPRKCHTLFLLPLFVFSAGTSGDNNDHPLMTDWVPRSGLSEAQQQQLHPACCGMFLPPQREDEWATTNPELAPMLIESPSGMRQPQRDMLLIPGPVEILQGSRSITANERSELDQSEETLNLRGDVVFREPGVMMAGESAVIDQRNNHSRLENAGYVLYPTQMHGYADSLDYYGETGFITINNGEFSRCEPGAPFWVLQATRLELDPARGMGRASELTLRVRDVPVFHYPWTLQFPITDDRMSGILAPSLSNSRRGGLDIAVPYYFNLAPHYDATVTPRLIEKRGAMASGEFRYLASWSMNTVNAGILPADRTFDPMLAEIPGSDSPPTRNRWFLGYEHEGIIGEHWSTLVDFGAVSDVDYFRDLGTRGLSVDNRTHLDRLAQIAFRRQDWRAEALIHRIDVIDPFLANDAINRPYDRLPELRLGTRQLADNGLQYGISGAWTRFDRSISPGMLSQEQIENGALVTGQRLSLEPEISLPWRTPGMFVVPSARYRHTAWQLNRQAGGTDATPSIGVPVFSVDSGLILDRELTLGNNTFNQTLEPRLYYLYSAYQAQADLPLFDTSQRRLSFDQLFRDNRFSGGDRFGDANQITAAVTTRLLDDDGLERAALSLGQIYHFRDRRVTPDSPLQTWLQLQPVDAPRSPIVAEAHYSFNNPENGLVPGNGLPHWQLRSNLHWNERRGKLEEGAVSVAWQMDDQRLFNAGFRYRELGDVFPQSPGGLSRRIRQTDVSGIVPLNDNWRLFGRWNYDHSNSRNLETFAGVEYSNCCTTMRVLLRDWVNDYEFLNQQARQNRGVYFQLSLHGLGNITGAGISNLLSDGIPGFKEHLFNE